MGKLPGDSDHFIAILIKYVTINLKLNERDLMIKSGDYINRIDFDKSLFSDILSCLDDTRKEYIPAKGWKEGIGMLGNDFDRCFNSNEMFNHWSGYAKNMISNRDLFWWHESLSEVDHLNVSDYNLTIKKGAAAGTMIELKGFKPEEIRKLKQDFNSETNLQFA